MKELGFTRSCQRANHLLQTPDTFVRAALPGMRNATAVVHAGPAIGAKFIQYTAEMEAAGTLVANGSQRFLFVKEGAIQVDCGNARETLPAGSYCYLPPAVDHRIVAENASVVIAIEKPYEPLSGTEKPAYFAGATQKVTASPLLGDPNVRVQMLLPDSCRFDFAINLLTFDPGASLPMVEIHVMEHGLMQLQGGGVYRLGECWHPITAGDFIYMAPYCPQWFGALGKQPAQYLLYKDWNRAPQASL